MNSADSIIQISNERSLYQGEIINNGITNEMIIVPSTDEGMCGQIYSNINGFLGMIPVIILGIIVLKMATTGSVDFKLVGLLAVLSMAMGVWYSLPLLC